jgi:polyhydroxybutyrate depolymerase
MRLASIIWQVVGALGAGLIALVVSAVVVLAGPPLSAEWGGRLQRAALQQGQIERHYRLYRPAVVKPRPGLVIDLHGAGTNGFLEELATRFDAQADRLQWLVAYPDGVADGWEPYGCCHHAGVDDVAFIADLIRRLESTDGVDPERVYITGLSRGGMLAYRLACELSSDLAAIAPVAGNMADERGAVRGVTCQPDRPVSVLAIHGSADAVVPIQGGGRFAPLEDVISRWRELNGCASAASATRGGPVTAMTWRCQAGSDVTAVVVQGAGHTWPGLPLNGLPWGARQSLDASRVIADFFEAHERASITP